MKDKEAMLKEFIFNKLVRDRKIDGWDNDQSLLQNGIIDSLGIVKLITFMERKFSIKVTDEDFIPDNFETINHLLSLIEQKQVDG